MKTDARSVTWSAKAIRFASETEQRPSETIASGRMSRVDGDIEGESYRGVKELQL